MAACCTLIRKREAKVGTPEDISGRPGVAVALASLDGGSGFFEELRLRAAAAPESEALLAPGRPAITFAGLSSRIDAVAGLLANAGLGRNDVVAVLMPDGPELLSIVLGVVSVAICAPVNPALRKAEIASCLSGLGARAVIIDAALNSPVGEVAGELGVSVLDAQRALSVSQPTRLAEHDRASDIALVLQTSATTGEPRLVPLTHSNLGAMAANTRGALRLTVADRFLSMMPLFHLTGLLSSLAQFLAGGSVISTSGFDSGMFLTWIEEFHPTWYTAAPALHSAILPLLDGRPDVLARFPLRFVRSIGAPMPRALLADLERALRVPVLEGYGMTEAGMVTSNALPPRKRKAGSVGRSAGVAVAILGDSEDLLSAGCEGQIGVRGPEVMHGYRNNAEADQSAFRGGWLLTGDVGYLDEEGFLFVTGRIKDVINRGGEKVSPQEIDEVLAAHPSVSEAVSFGVAHPTLGEDVAAAVVLIPGASVTETELRRFAAQRLADFKVPRRIVFPDSIPKGPTGKARRSTLAEQFPGSVTCREPATLDSTGQRLAAIWRRLLSLGDLDPEDDFFLLGGDSLTAATMLSEVWRTFHLSPERFSALDFFDQPTIASLAGLIEAAQSGSSAGDCIALRAIGSRSPLFCVPASGQGPYYLRHLAKRLGCDQPFYAVCPAAPSNAVLSIQDAAGLAVDAIRRVQRQGPYLIAGHCYGGVVAFEAARPSVPTWLRHLAHP
jgi:acyl-CoA synthetase (AMP-forming)/AMP-acid ligase II